MRPRSIRHAKTGKASAGARHVIAAARRRIWQKAFPPELPCAALDFDMLARLDIAGGNISVIAINAAFLAAAEDAPLGMPHIMRAARAEYHKIDREFRANLFGGAPS